MTYSQPYTSLHLVPDTAMNKTRASILYGLLDEHVYEEL